MTRPHPPPAGALAVKPVKDSITIQPSILKTFPGLNTADVTIPNADLVMIMTARRACYLRLR